MAGIGNKPTHLLQGLVFALDRTLNGVKHRVQSSIEPSNLGFAMALDKSRGELTALHRLGRALNLF